MATKKEIEKYLALPWTYTIESEENYFIIYVNELPGVCTDADTIEKGMKEIKSTMYAAIELYLEQGDEVPVPLDKKKFKGKIAYRTTPETHYRIAKIAKQEKVSINRTLDLLIAEGMKHHNPSVRLR